VGCRAFLLSFSIVQRLSTPRASPEFFDLSVEFFAALRFRSAMPRNTTATSAALRAQLARAQSATLQKLACAVSPSFRATAREGSLCHAALYRGTLPLARTASAHAAVTRGPKPRPRNASAVSRPAAAAVSERLAQKQMLTGHPPSLTANTGARPAEISPSCQSGKLRASQRSSATGTVPAAGAKVSGKMNAGPAKPGRPLVNERYAAADTGAARRSRAGGSCCARTAICSANSSGTSS